MANNVAGPRSVYRMGTIKINGRDYPFQISREAFNFFEGIWSRTGADTDLIAANTAAAEAAQKTANAAQDTANNNADDIVSHDLRIGTNETNIAALQRNALDWLAL